MEENQGGETFRRTPGEWVKGEWTCADCGAAVTELPFQPTDGRPVYCRDCYRKNNPRRNNFRR
ncbi:MAG: hypothetical protein HYS89_00560 [Candidatus Colwellbacteria bacterium]|nr:hypothetical protein [Candidatus Colwellbacteria bacterium]